MHYMDIQIRLARQEDISALANLIPESARTLQATYWPITDRRITTPMHQDELICYRDAKLLRRVIGNVRRLDING
jgi:hypothetical protein